MESTNLIKFLCASADDLLRAPATDAAAAQQRLDEATEMLNLASRIMARNAAHDAKFDRRAA